MRNKIETGIDTYSLYYTLTSKQKSKILEQLKNLPGFRKEVSSYAEKYIFIFQRLLCKKGR